MLDRPERSKVDLDAFRARAAALGLGGEEIERALSVSVTLTAARKLLPADELDKCVTVTPGNLRLRLLSVRAREA